MPRTGIFTLKMLPMAPRRKCAYGYGQVDFLVFGMLFKNQSVKPVYTRRKHHQEYVDRFSPGIKKQAEDEKAVILQLERYYVVKQHKCCKEKEKEWYAGKDHLLFSYEFKHGIIV